MALVVPPEVVAEMRAEAEAVAAVAARESRQPEGISPVDGTAKVPVSTAAAGATVVGGATLGQHEEEMEPDPEGRRLSIELATARGPLPVLEGHREPRGSDAASREQPDMLQMLDLLNQGRRSSGIVKPTAHYERAAQAAMAGGAPAELSIWLADGNSAKQKSKGRVGAKAARRAQTAPAHEELR